MSTTQNQEWLVAAQENADQALAEENWELANEIVDDIRGAGFEHEADILRKTVLLTQANEMHRLVQDDHFPTEISQDKEELYQERKEKNLAWLTEMGRTEGDVMEDENGEYVYLESETGLDKTYLPFASEIDKTF